MSFCDQRNFTGLMLKGYMEVLGDPKSKNMIWQETDTQYYKEGVADPNYCVLKFTAKSARLYCNLRTSEFCV
ncbi:pyridoxamine 5'-phosphate oxidase family protein [Desulfovibrio sp. OttesenSCG-928-M14]|nr:pyridoxamine 5'-phosphate oxidase family protein [Desulfovibrio sp. OttesenSCG-928-M14]